MHVVHLCITHLGCASRNKEWILFLFFTSLLFMLLLAYIYQWPLSAHAAHRMKYPCTYQVAANAVSQVNPIMGAEHEHHHYHRQHCTTTTLATDSDLDNYSNRRSCNQNDDDDTEKGIFPLSVVARKTDNCFRAPASWLKFRPQGSPLVTSCLLRQRSIALGLPAVKFPRSLSSGDEEWTVLSTCVQC